MAERTLAKMVHDFECSLDEYKRGNIDEEVLKTNFYSLKTGIANIVSRYCDDFSCVEYYNELTKLALDSVEESRQEEKSKDDQSV
mgnify:FL=1